jgi:Ser/Thr protein kinase RdoA (MazF antagonist)
MNRESSFFSLTPERVLEAAERAGLEVTGRCFALNSYENRVYDIELDEPDSVANRRRHIIAKFYRPGRWTAEQILEEHSFIQELRKAEVPAIAPIAFHEGKTLSSFEGEGGPIFYTIFPRVGGRAPDELNLEQYVRVGSLLARIHNVGASKPARQRVQMTTQTFGTSPLEFLVSGKWIDASVESRFVDAAQAIIANLDRAGFNAVPKIRTHGDCHLGNLLINPEGQFSFVDFDDHMRAPASQDLWLILPTGPDRELPVSVASAC